MNALLQTISNNCAQYHSYSCSYSAVRVQEWESTQTLPCQFTFANAYSYSHFIAAHTCAHTQSLHVCILSLANKFAPCSFARNGTQQLVLVFVLLDYLPELCHEILWQQFCFCYYFKLCLFLLLFKLGKLLLT